MRYLADYKCSKKNLAGHESKDQFWLRAPDWSKPRRHKFGMDADIGEGGPPLGDLDLTKLKGKEKFQRSNKDLTTIKYNKFESTGSKSKAILLNGHIMIEKSESFHHELGSLHAALLQECRPEVTKSDTKLPRCFQKLGYPKMDG